MNLCHLQALVLLGFVSTHAFLLPCTRQHCGSNRDWTSLLASEDSNEEKSAAKPHIVVVGAGWGGWGAAKAACEGGARVTLLDAVPDPTGRTPYLSPTGKPVEAGTRGFWKDYPNIQSMCHQLNISKPFTDFTNSSFYSPDGLEATAPVFSRATINDFFQLSNPQGNSDTGGASFSLNQLPSPLGQVLATFPLFERIPLADRASMVGLLIATVDCLANPGAQEAYDRMTGQELFLRFGLSERLVNDFITPTLLVGLFKPPEELSALVVMELLYYYALAHVDSFDVQWIRRGTVSDTLIAPLAEYLESNYDISVLGGCFVETVSTTTPLDDTVASRDSRIKSISYRNTKTQTTTIIDQDIDGVVLALTCKGMTAVVNASPDLAHSPFFSLAASSRGIDVISVRLWLDTTVATRTPANVFSRFSALRGAGGTFFMLDQLQKDHIDELWGSDQPQGSVVACDFYNAGGLLSLPDEKLVQILMEDLLPAAVPAFQWAKVVDSWVGKYPGVVSWFSPGSFTRRPTLETPIRNLKCAGDWVRMGDREHGAKGLCQERAMVSGFEAANSLLRDLDLNPHVVLPVREDEPQFKAAMALNKQVMQLVPRFWVR